MLNLITKIKDKSMDMHFRISDVIEKYRTLHHYKLIDDNHKEY